VVKCFALSSLWRRGCCLTACCWCQWSRVCVSMDEMGCFEFCSFYVDTDVMRVYEYVVGADGHVSSSLGGLSFLAFFGGLTGRVLICCSLLASFKRSEACLWCCFWFYGKWVPCDVNVNLNWNYE
jgi:hypothetical protein